MTYFTDRLKELRKEKKLTQKEIAEQIGIKRNSYSDWETGKNEPNLENIVKLSKILGTTIDFLLGKSSLSNSNSELDSQICELSLLLRKIHGRLDSLESYCNTEETQALLKSVRSKLSEVTILEKVI